MNQSLEFYKVKQVAEILDVHPSTIFRLVRSKSIPFVKVRGVVRIPKSDFEKWLEQGGDITPDTEPEALASV